MPKGPGTYGSERGRPRKTKSDEELTREITAQRVRAGSPSKPVSPEEVADKRKRQRPIKTVTKVNSSTEYKRLGLYLAEAMGYRVDEIAILAPLGAAAAAAGGVAARIAAGVGKGAVGAAKAGAKAVGGALKTGGKMAKRKAIQMAKDRIAQKAQGNQAEEEDEVGGSYASGERRAEELIQQKKKELQGEGKIMNRYIKNLMEAHEADPRAKGTSDPTGFAHPIARSSGGAKRSSKAIKDPVKRKGAKKAKKRMEKKLQVKPGSTNPQAQHMVQVHLNARMKARRERAAAAKSGKKKGRSREPDSIFPELDKKTQAALDADDRKKRAGPDG